jgi:hypothetical protein
VAQWLRIGNPRDWAPSIHVYLSPTDTLLAPFAILSLMIVAQVVSDPEAQTRRAGRILALVAAVTLLAKPSFTIAFLPGVVLYVVLGWRRTSHAADSSSGGSRCQVSW